MSIKYLFSKAFFFLQIPSLKDCTIDKTSYVRPQSNLIRVKMGKFSYVGIRNTMSDVEIGAFCSIGSNCSIGGGYHPLDCLSTSPVFYDKRNGFRVKDFIVDEMEETTQPKTYIGNDVWIGDFCYIKAGVRIGDGAVIGAHSIVTHDIEPYAIVVGVPARILRYRFNKDIINELLKIQWWNLDEDVIKQNKHIFGRIGLTTSDLSLLK